MAGWLNDDGLYVKFGTEEVDPTFFGEVSTDGMERELELYLKAEELAAVGSVTWDLGDSTRISATDPDGWFLESGQITVTEAFVGATATLDLGFGDDDRTTEYDFDGIDAAVDVGALTLGAVIDCDGALIGTTLSNSTDVLITARNNTADFTAGELVLKLKFRVLP